MLDHQARPALYSAAMVDKILQAYGLDGRGAEVLPMSQGFGMALARVRLGDRDLVVKQLSPDRPPERIRFALRYHAHLHDAGIPCPRLYRTSVGGELAVVEDRLFCLQDWCGGERFDPDAADAGTRRRRRRQLGALLGRVHAAATPELLAAAPATCRRPPAQLFTGLPPVARGLPWSRGGPLARRAWLLTHERGAFGRELRRVLPLLEAARRRLVASPLAAHAQLDEILPVHGDFHFENVLFAADRVAGLLDFDNAAVTARACDLGSALAVVCQRREHEEDFLAAYEEGSGLRRPDAELLRACVRLRLVNSLGFQIVALTRRRVASPDKARWWVGRLIGLLEAELRDGEAPR